MANVSWRVSLKNAFALAPSYYVMRSREPASFWREKVVAVVIRPWVLAML